METIPQFIPRHYCLRCQGCCRFTQRQSPWSPHLSEAERQTLGELPIVANPSGANFLCGFLNPKSNVCSVYAQRPFECQLYPFLLRRAGKTVFAALDRGCTFVIENRNKPEFQEFCQRMVAYLQTADVRSLIAHNPQLAQPYEGVEDLAELSVTSAHET